MEKLDITVLVNDCVNESKLLAEHGLSIFISFIDKEGPRNLLLDTGQSGEVLLHNLEKLKINLDNLMAIVISHGHYDHTGGLLRLLKLLKREIPVLIHPDAWGPRMKKNPYFRSIGSGLTPAEIQKAGGSVIVAKNPVFLTEHIQLSGAIERNEPLEQNFSFLRTSHNELVNDDIQDDISLIINLGDIGLILVTGCCHAGIINTTKHALKLTGNSNIRGIIGGLHLIGASEERLQSTAEFLKDIDPKMVLPLHCSGLKGSSFLWKTLGDTIRFIGAGETISIL